MFAYYFVGVAQTAGALRVTHVNGEKTGRDVAPWDYANQIGRQGWELVAVMHSSTHEIPVQMIFKKRVG